MSVKLVEEFLKETRKNYEYDSISEEEIESEKQKPIFNCAKKSKGEFYVWGNYRDMPFNLAASWIRHINELGPGSYWVVVMNMGNDKYVEVKFKNKNSFGGPECLRYRNGDGGPLYAASKEYQL